MNFIRFTALWLTSVLISITLYSQTAPLTTASISSATNGTGSQSVVFSSNNIFHINEQTKGGEFFVIGINGCGNTNEVGKPQLPVLRKDIEVPIDARISLQITDYAVEEYSLSAWGRNIKIMPLQPSVSRLQNVNVPFALDATTYSTNDYILNRIARVVSEKIVRDRKFVTIEVNFVDYNPVQGKIKVYSDVQVSLTYRNQVKGIQPQSKYRSNSFDRSNQSLLKNTMSASSLTAKEGYLIVSAPGYQTSLAPFVQEKQKKFDVTVVTTATTGTTTTGIKAYIQNAYDTWAVPPVYVLLVGDIDQVPCWWTNVPTDLYYSTVQGTDYFPDIYVGRVSVTNATQLNNWIAKAVQTQNTKKHSWTAGSDQTPLGYGLGVDAETDYCVANYFDPVGWTSTKNFVTDYGSSTVNRIRNDVNNGVGLVSYNGHGAATAWIDGMNWDKSDVDALSNSIYPVVFAFGCNTGEYTQNECLGESWIRASHGATAYVGSTITSAWREDGYLGRGIYSACSTGMTELGEIVNNGKHQVFLEEGDVPKVQQYYEQYNILGDPSQEIITAVVQATTAPLPPTLLSPSIGTIGQSLSLMLQWNSSDSAVAYRLQLSTSSAFTAGTIVVDDSILFSPSRHVGPLDTNTTYYWRVSARNNAGTSAYSSVWRFTTQLSPPTVTDNWLYQDGIVAPWRDSSWSSTINYASTEQVFSGSSSIKAIQTAWGAVSMRSGPMGSGIDVPPSPYSGIEFAIYNTTPGLVLNVFGYNDQGIVFPDNVQSNIPINQWTVISVPMSQLNPNNSVIHRINIQNYTRLAPTYFVDNVRLVSANGVLATEEIHSTLPTDFTLNQNYPNPFNPSTRLSYSLPKNAKVTLNVYDVLGQLVNTVVDEIQHAGYQSVEWNSANGAGHAVASGVYIYRLEAVSIDDPTISFVQMKKMVLLR